MWLYNRGDRGCKACEAYYHIYILLTSVQNYTCRVGHNFHHSATTSTSEDDWNGFQQLRLLQMYIKGEIT
jgi:hypothetical protein